MSESLFHYIDDLERMLEILDEGFVPNFHLEDLSSSENNDLFRGIPMVSFCDIEPNSSSKHRKNYGNYCIGLKKNWALCSNISPVMYVASPELLKTVESDLIESDLLGYIKKYSSHWDDNPDYINYDECEWRYVVENRKVCWMTSKVEYDNWRGDTKYKRPKPKADLRKNVLKFTINDITYLCLPTEEERESLIDGICKLSHFSGNECNLTDDEINHLINTITIISCEK